MHNLVGCAVTQRHFDNWTHLLVADAAPYFLSDNLLSSIPAEIPCFPRRSGMDQQMSLALRDSYSIYRVDPAYQHVVFLTDAALRSLRPRVREQLLYAQWRGGRGQVYDWERFTELFPSDTRFGELSDFAIDTEAGRKCILGDTLWHSLPADRQECWLRRFVADHRHPYPTMALNSIELPPPRTLQLSSLANTFAFTSGPNCFATTLAAITETPEYAHTISMLWLHQDMFLHGLTVSGYTRNHAVDACTEGLSDAVVIWSDDAGTPRHTCWLIGQGIALSKNGQAWYDPRHLAAIRDVLALWEEDNYHVQVYTRTAA